MTLPPHDSPLWGVARLGILMAGLVGILYFSAAQFDSTEIKAIAEFSIVLFATDGGLALLKGRK